MLISPDYANNRIRKISTLGIITTIAGNGSSGFSGDGGPATAARLYQPSYVIVHNGSLYIADYFNQRIRKVNPSGIISTIAGNGSGGFGGDGGAATAASLYYPTSIAFDRAGNMYIVDEANDRVRMVSTSGIIRTFAGGGSTTTFGGPATGFSLYRPGGITIDTSDNVYIADVTSNRIVQVNTSGTINLYAVNGSASFSGDGGPATAAGLNRPLRIFIDSAGTLYFGDQGNDRARKISALGIVTISYTTTNICGSTYAIHIVYIRSGDVCKAGVNDLLPVVNGISVSPNPNNGLFVVKIPGIATDISITVLDVTGRIIAEVQHSGGKDTEVPFDLHKMAPGTYLLRAGVDGAMYYDKIVIW